MEKNKVISPDCPLCEKPMMMGVSFHHDSLSIEQYFKKIQIKEGEEISSFSCPLCKTLVLESKPKEDHQ